MLLEQRQGFRRARARPEEPPAAEARPGPPPRRRSLCPPPPPRAGRPSPRRLVKPLLFAVGVSGSRGPAVAVSGRGGEAGSAGSPGAGGGSAAGPPSVSGALVPVHVLALLRAERRGTACNVRSGGARLPRPKPRDGAFMLTLSGIAQFTGSAFGSAAIWQYESLKSRVQTYFEEARADWLDKIRPQKRGDFRKQVHGARLSLLAHGWVRARA